jgi:hypothetical protein
MSPCRLRACSRAALSVDTRYGPVKTASSWGLCRNMCAYLTGGLTGDASTRAAAHWPTAAMRCAIVWECGDIRSTRIALSVGALVAGRAARATYHKCARAQTPVVRSGSACSRGSCVCCDRRRRSRRSRRSGRNSASPPHVRATLLNHSGQPATARPRLKGVAVMSHRRTLFRAITPLLASALGNRTGSVPGARSAGVPAATSLPTAPASLTTSPAVLLGSRPCTTYVS